MLDVDWDVRTVDGPPPATGAADGPEHDPVSLVAAVVRNETPVPRRVVLRNTAERPVLPPRHRGVPESGWREDGFAGTVPAEGRLPLGFAVAGPPADPPVEVLDRGRADGADTDGPAPADLLRELGSPAPPREAVPAGDDGASEAVPAGDDDVSETGHPAGDAGYEPASDPDAVPAHVGAWLDAVEDRVGRGATETGDRAALRRVAERAAALADRCSPEPGAGGGP